MMRLIRPALTIFYLLTIITGLLYPALITGLAQVLFPAQANGSLIVHNNQVVGSQLIGQQFDAPGYFWGRLSATIVYPYNAAVSSGSNLGPTNPALKEAINARIEALHAADPDNTQLIPVDLVTASASGLDPDISIAAAQYQAARIARERGLTAEAVQNLIDQSISRRTFGFLGEQRVNVLALNLALDGIQ